MRAGPIVTKEARLHPTASFLEGMDFEVFQLFLPIVESTYEAAALVSNTLISRRLNEQLNFFRRSVPLDIKPCCTSGVSYCSELFQSAIFVLFLLRTHSGQSGSASELQTECV